MKKQTVVAYTGTGTEKVKVGEQVINVPENLKEAVSAECFGSEAELIAAAMRSKVIEVQANIRNPNKDPLGKLFRSLSKAQQEELLKKAGLKVAIPTVTAPEKKQ